MSKKSMLFFPLLVTTLTVCTLRADIVSDLVAWWALDDASGTTATDSAGHPGGPHDGSLQNGPQWERTDAQVGRGALMLDGVDDRIVVEPFDLEGTGITISTWIKPPNLAAMNDPRLVSKAQGGGTPDHYWALVLSGSGEDNLEFRLRTDVGGATRRTSPEGNDMRPDEWAHLSVTWDASDTFMRLYKNAQEIDSVSKSGAAVGVGPDVSIGVGNQSVSAGASSMDRPFPGILDEVRVYERGLSADDIIELFEWRGAPVSPTLAVDPSPADGAADVSRDAAFGWTAGEFAVTHDVYLGTSFDDVNTADRSNPMDVRIYQGLNTNRLDSERLAFNQTYYWRVDEVNGAPDFTVFKGDVWSFTVEPIALPITGITATASSAFGVSIPENTINGSGLVDDLHSTSAGDMWISTAVPATIEYAFDQVYKLHGLWIWNSNQLVEPFVGFGAKDVVIEHSLDGTNWTMLDGVAPLAQGPGAEGYAHNNTIDFGRAVAQHVRLTINSVQGFAPQASLSEVRFLYIPTLATRPSPESGAGGVAPDVTLSWGRNGREADRHEVYFGTDPDNMSLAGTVTESSFDTGSLGLMLGETYHWRIDEINEAMDPSIWEGSVWSFSTVDRIVVDDMESYADRALQEIWATWVDGFEDPANGSLVGNGPAGLPETTIVNGGRQSLPLHFDNSGAGLSEATRTFDPAQDWTIGAPETLVLHFHGDLNNSGGQVYVKINNTKVTYDADPSAISSPVWTQWNIDLSGVGLVNSLTIGVEGAGVQGVLYVDDLILSNP